MRIYTCHHKNKCHYETTIRLFFDPQIGFILLNRCDFCTMIIIVMIIVIIRTMVGNIDKALLNLKI